MASSDLGPPRREGIFNGKVSERLHWQHPLAAACLCFNESQELSKSAGFNAVVVQTVSRRNLIDRGRTNASRRIPAPTLRAVCIGLPLAVALLFIDGCAAGIAGLVVALLNSPSGGEGTTPVPFVSSLEVHYPESEDGEIETRNTIFVDFSISGEGNGPLGACIEFAQHEAPEEKETATLAQASADLHCSDVTVTTMGIAPRRLK
jgi:hypothetical protein